MAASLLMTETATRGHPAGGVTATSWPCAAHTALLGAGIPIVEHLTSLHHLPPQGFRFFAVPPAIEAAASFPVRAFAILG